ncbi:hypothetical protein ACHAWF_008062 [Thalassiosira exigua]
MPTRVQLKDARTARTGPAALADRPKKSPSRALDRPRVGIRLAPSRRPTRRADEGFENRKLGSFGRPQARSNFPRRQRRRARSEAGTGPIDSPLPSPPKDDRKREATCRPAPKAQNI